MSSLPVNALAARIANSVASVPELQYRSISIEGIRLKAIYTPGHTDGSSCLAMPHRKVLFTGDALVTLSIVTGERTPRVMPGSFNKNSPQALESLNELKGLAAELILPGHGEPWHGSVNAAIVLAQQTGPN